MSFRVRKRHQTTRIVALLLALLAPFSFLVIGNDPAALATTASNFYLIAGSGGIPSALGTSGATSTSANFGAPTGTVADSKGNLLVADTSNNQIDLVVRASASDYSISGVSSPAIGSTYVLAGGGAVAASAGGASATTVSLNSPNAVAIDASGNVLIADSYNYEVDVVAESATNPGYLISGTWAVGNLYLIAGGGTGGAPTVGGGVATSATLGLTKGIAVNADGDVIISDASHDEIDLISLHTSTSGTSRVAGDVYVIAGGGTGGQATSTGIAATSVQFNGPAGIAIDPHGDIAIADTGDNAVDVLALSSSNPGYGVGASWITGDVYRVLGGGGSAPTTSGVLASKSYLDAPQGVAFDVNGDLLVADVHHYAAEVLAVTSANPGYSIATGSTWTAGDVFVIAGQGLSNVSTLGTIASQTHLYAPVGISELPDGSVGMLDQSSKLLELLILSPSRPQSLSTVASGTSAVLNWGSPQSDGGSSITGYTVFVYDAGQTIPVKTIVLDAAAKSTTVSGLSAGASYDFTVGASNAIGISAPSIMSSVAIASITSSSPPTTTPSTTTPSTTTSSATSAPTTSPQTSTSTTTPATSTSSPTSSGSASTSRHSRVRIFGGTRHVVANDIPFTVRCGAGSCAGAVTILERHRAKVVGRHGSVSVIEESVVARVIYSDAAGVLKHIRVPLTSYGRRLASMLKRKGITVVAIASTRRGRPAETRFRMLARRKRRRRRR